MANYQPVEEKFPAMDVNEHIAQKDMWAGAHDHSDVSCYTFYDNSKIIKTTMTYPLSLEKTVDEAIVNAIDHTINTTTDYANLSNDQKYRDFVCDEIDINYTTDGVFSIKNTGVGVPTDWHSGKKMYTPSFIFGTVFSGSNLSKKPGSITGGTNGVGIKVANICSEIFTLETCYLNKDGYLIKFRQSWSELMRKTSDPEIFVYDPKRNVYARVDSSLGEKLYSYVSEKIPAYTAEDHKIRPKQYTKITFKPKYVGQFRYNAEQLTEETFQSLSRLFKYRAYLASAYVGYFTSLASSRQCKVYYNNAQVPVKNIQDMAKVMFPTSTTIRETIQVPILVGEVKKGQVRQRSNYNWEICVCVTPNPDSGVISLVNGVSVRAGKHANLILNQLVEGTKAHVMDKKEYSNINFQPSFVKSNLILFINAQIPDPRWSGQRKDELEYDSANWSKYKLPEEFISKVAKALRSKIIASIYKGSSVLGLDKTKTKTKKGEIVANLDKYTEAELCSKRPMDCALMLPEGDSAASMCRRGITFKYQGKPLLGFDKYGILTLRGVIMNVRKAIKIERDPQTGKIIGMRISEKLNENEFFKNFLKVTGLDLEHKYDPKSPSYKKEMEQLRYGCIIGCVDQDLDGTGFIFSLILNMFEIFWPNLLAAGYVKRFQTPVRRIKPKSGGKILDLYSDFEYNQWCNLDASHTSENYHIEYIKGLGFHSPDEVIWMFKNFHNNLLTYTADHLTPQYYEALFGHDSELRKKILKEPQKIPPEELIKQQRQTLKVSATDHAIYETEPYKRDNLKRKLWSIVDGMNVSGRKILDGAIKVFAHSNQKIKVATLQAKIGALEEYHHGEASMQQSIFGKALICPGGVQLPQILPLGEFGSRARGGDDHASARYAMTKLNKKLVELLYPHEDTYILTYTLEDGERVEPDYFIPILPMAMLESIHMPSDGWKIKVWARDVFDVIKICKNLITDFDSNYEKTKTIEVPEPLPFISGFTGEIKEINGKTYSFGKYTLDEKNLLVYISELPLRVWHENYKDHLLKNKSILYVDKVTKKSTFDKKIVEERGKEKYTEVKILKGIFNKSNDDHIDIKIMIAEPNAGYIPMKFIKEYNNIFKDETSNDGVQSYFELYDVMDNHLNFINIDNTSVIECKNYVDILSVWFKERKDCYKKRIDRQIIILKLQIMLLENIILFVDKVNQKQINISKLDESVADKMLEENKFAKLDDAIIKSPQFTLVDHLEDLATNKAYKNVNYDYIYKLTERDKLTKAIDLREKKLIEKKNQLAELLKQLEAKPFPGASIWLDELDKLEQVIKEGQETRWMFGENKKYKFEK